LGFAPTSLKQARSIRSYAVGSPSIVWGQAPAAKDRTRRGGPPSDVKRRKAGSKAGPSGRNVSG